jgi:Na+/H+ antiporter NhaA
MKILKLISGLSIGVLILLVSILSFLGTIDASSIKNYMLIGTILWFVVTPFWMKEE